MKKYAIVLVYSLIIFFFYNVSLFVASVLSSSAEPNLHMSLITSIFILTITAFFSYLFRQSITISTLQLAIITTVFTIILVLLITIPNQTTVIFFSNWSELIWGKISNQIYQKKVSDVYEKNNSKRSLPS